LQGKNREQLSVRETPRRYFGKSGPGRDAVQLKIEETQISRYLRIGRFGV
jgi:hypothetical protein